MSAPITAFSRALFAACILTASLGCASAQVGQGPEGDAFYTPPSPLAPAAHGAVIWTRPLTGPPALASAARNVLVLYHSRDLADADVAVSGTISIPPGQPPAGGWPIITWTHGTTGMVAACAPSRDTPDSPEHGFLAQKQALLDGYVKQGYAVVATDYQGLGGPGLHPFLQGVIEGRGALDIIRAAREIEPSLSARYAVLGHSQGGQADLFTAAIGPTYAPELTLVGNAAFAPASHIAATVKNMRTATAPMLQLGYAMYVLESFASNHPEVDLAKILTPQAIANLPVTRQLCITETVTKSYWAAAIPKDQFLPNADLASVEKIAAQNDPANLRISVPTFIAQGTDDDTVLPWWTDETVRALCANGVAVTYKVFPGKTHESVLDAGAAYAHAFIAARFKGEPAPGNCSALPRAGERAR